MGRIAPNSCNAKAVIWLRMCRLTFDPPDRKTTVEDGHKATDEKKPQTAFDKYIHGMRVAPLSEAYVLLLKTTRACESINPDPANAILCRTTKTGELVKVQESALDDGVPESSPENQMLSPALESFEYYWTFSEARFKYVLGEVRKDYARAKTVHDFFSFQVDYASLHDDVKAPNRFELLKEHPVWGDVIASILSDNVTSRSERVAGLVNSGFLLDWQIEGSIKLAWKSPYLMARRRVADAVYCAELAQYHVIGLLQRSAKEFAAFSYVQNICDKAHRREWVPLSDQPKDNLEFLHYAFRCGCDARVKQDLFQGALPDGFWSWQGPAMEIKKITGGQCIHPCDTGSDYRWSEAVERDPIMNYFDYYRFGLQKDVNAWMASARVSRDAIHYEQEQLREKIRTLLAQISYNDLLVCQGNYLDDPAVDKKLHQRFLDVSIDVYHRWWDEFHPEDDAVWEKLQPYLNNSGSAIEKSFDIYAEHFNKHENIEKYHHMLHTASEAEDMLRKHEVWNGRLGGPSAPLKDNGLEVTTDFEKGIVRIQKGAIIENGKVVRPAEPVLEMQLLLRTVKKRSIKVPYPSETGWQYWERKGSITQTVDVRLKDPFPGIKKWPKYFNVFGQVLSLTVSAAALAKKIQEDSGASERAIAVTRVAKDTFQTVTGFGELLHGALPYAKKAGMVSRFAKFGERIANPGYALEIILNLYEGSILLTDDALAKSDDQFTAAVQVMKGSALVASGSYAGFELLAAVWAAAVPAVGMPLALGALAVVACEIAVGLHKGPSRYTRPILQALEEARDKEFGKGFKEDRTLNSLREFASTVDLLISNQHLETAWQATTQSGRASTSH